MSHLLLVEDDELLQDGLRAQLVGAGHTAIAVSNGSQALVFLESQRFDGVVLDLGLPPTNGIDMDGIQVLRTIRQRLSNLPVLILTARDDIDDRVQGLNAGADDYLTKPFEMVELLARLAAMLRRSRMPAFDSVPDSEHSCKHLLRIDPDLPLAWLGDDTMDLTQREWSLLKLLLGQVGHVVSREDVFSVWQTQAPEMGASGSNALEVYIHRLRRKLHDSGLTIRNIRGLGYMLELQNS
jgi:DNA-binding response OmpR family regulator